MKTELDLHRFWLENAQSTGKPFRTDKPRAPAIVAVDDHWLMEEMRLPVTVRYYQDAAYLAQINRACNDRCEPVIGRRPFNENVEGPSPLRIEELFGCRRELIEGGTPWLESTHNDIADLTALLDRVERLSDAEFRELVFSTGYRPKRLPAGPNGQPATVTPRSRGPATVGTSVIGTTRWAYWLVDHPDEMHRFYALLADTLVRYHRLLAAQQGAVVRGFCWLDDNCALLSPAMYEEFCMPVMRQVFNTFASAPGDQRFQHSDSDMGHLLPLLATLDFTAVNFGPNILAADIRRLMPRTEICGQVAPMTLRNGTLEQVVAEVRRDFAAVGGDGGLSIHTAGSISAGTSLEAIRGYLWAVDRYCRYDGRGAD